MEYICKYIVPYTHKQTHDQNHLFEDSQLLAQHSAPPRVYSLIKYFRVALLYATSCWVKPRYIESLQQYSRWGSLGSLEDYMCTFADWTWNEFLSWWLRRTSCVGISVKVNLLLSQIPPPTGNKQLNNARHNGHNCGSYKWLNCVGGMHVLIFIMMDHSGSESWLMMIFLATITALS